MSVNSLIVKSAGDFLVKHTMKLRKYAPEILTGLAAAGTVVGTIMACKATTKLDEIMTDANTQVDEIHRIVSDPEVGEDVYSEEDSKKDLAIVYTKTGVKIAKLYAPSVAVIGLSLVSMFASTSISRKRNVALAAAYAAIDQGFKDYRKRVVERFGDTVDKELKYNIKAEQISEQVTDDDTGKKRKVRRTIGVVEYPEYSDYAKIFDEYNPEWKSDAEHNLYFLNSTQRWANDRLRSRGHLFLNEVYEALGFEDTKAGQCVGWIYNTDKETQNGDNYVDFGIFDVHSPRARDFVNGFEPSIVLDFNVDGPILDLI